MKQISEDARLLPLAKIDGREFLVDVNRREFRNFNNPGNVIKMHSVLGRQIVSGMQGTEWRAFAVDEPIWGRQRWPEV